MRRHGAIIGLAACLAAGLAPAHAEVEPARWAALGAPKLAPGVDTLPMPAVAAPSAADRAGVADEIRVALQRMLERDEHALLASFYAGRNYSPAWIREDGFTRGAEQVLARLARAGEDGLDPAHYASPEPGSFGAARTPAEAVAETEIAISAAVMRYVRDAQSGRIAPGEVSGYITAEPDRPDAIAALAEIASARYPAQALAAYNPPHEGFRALRRALAELREADGEPEAMVEVPGGSSLRPGMRDTRVAALRERLGIMSDADPDLYDSPLEAAVRAYQESRGLGVDGVVGPQTLGLLNTNEHAREADIIANMERWRWLPRDMGDLHVHVNIADFTLAIVRGGEPYYTSRVIVGTPDNQTPIFSNAISHIVVNPYWNVPSSIAVNELLPQLKRNPYALSSRGFEVVSQNGNRIDPGRVDWWGSRGMPYRIRQAPGENNALGRIKFMFPNDHAVYLHDTPQRTLFDRQARALSHGCVRVQNPFEFADALLVNEKELNADRLRGLIGRSERWVSLQAPVPVHLSYFTTFVDEAGDLQVRADMYGHDRRLKAALGL